jgi:hypothetical protein
MALIILMVFMVLFYFLLLDGVSTGTAASSYT